MNLRELRAKLAELLKEARELLEGAGKESRALNEDEQAKYDGLLEKAEELRGTIKEYERLLELGQEVGDPEGGSEAQRRQAPNVNLKTRRGDSFERAFAHYLRTGDGGGVAELQEPGEERGRSELRVDMPAGRELRAVDSTMNVTTTADGGAAVPTGFAGTIALRRNEVRLSERLGVRMVPGVGTTVNFPYENADPSVFAATSEQADNYANTYERDVAPVLNTKDFTLAKKSKKLALTEELLDDEDANLMTHVADTVGRAMGITHNSMLLTEVAASGTALKTFAATGAIAAGEPEDLVFHSTAAYYLDDGGSIGWVMRPATYGTIVELTGNTRQYVNVLGPKMELLGYPVMYSNQAAAPTGGATSVYFGNWYYVGMREDPALRFIRDPYTTDGIVYLKYSFRAVYGVLIAGAIGYGKHPTA